MSPLRLGNRSTSSDRCWPRTRTSDLRLRALRRAERGRDFSFDPRTLELRAETGGGQHGMSFDDTGRKFVCSNSDHLQYWAHDEPRAGLPPARPGARVRSTAPAQPVCAASAWDGA